MNPDNEEVKVNNEKVKILQKVLNALDFKEEAKIARDIVNKCLKEGNMNFSLGALKRLYIGGDDEDKLLAQNLLRKKIESNSEDYSRMFSYVSRNDTTIYPNASQVYDIILNRWKAAAMDAINQDIANNKGKRK